MTNPLSPAAGTEADGSSPALSARGSLEDGFERVGWLVFGAVAALAAGLMIWLGHGSTFTLDELIWLMGTPNLDLSDALQPHNGHLIFVSRVLYKLILETVGTDYLTFRLLG